MSSAPVALLLLNVQRHVLEGQPHEREVALRWARRIEAARAAGELVVLVQWDGDPDTPGETFTKGWTLYPDFRAEEGDLLIRAPQPDAFASWDLHPGLQARGVQALELLTLPGDPHAQTTAQAAAALGYRVSMSETVTEQEESA